MTLNINLVLALCELIIASSSAGTTTDHSLVAGQQLFMNTASLFVTTYKPTDAL